MDEMSLPCCLPHIVREVGGDSGPALKPVIVLAHPLELQCPVVSGSSETVVSPLQQQDTCVHGQSPCSVQREATTKTSQRMGYEV